MEQMLAIKETHLHLSFQPIVQMLTIILLLKQKMMKVNKYQNLHQ